MWIPAKRSTRNSAGTSQHLQPLFSAQLSAKKFRDGRPRRHTVWLISQGFLLFFRNPLHVFWARRIETVNTLRKASFVRNFDPDHLSGS